MKWFYHYTRLQPSKKKTHVHKIVDCLSFSDLRFLITPFVSSNSSYKKNVTAGRISTRRVWRYQRSKQNPLMKDRHYNVQRKRTRNHLQNTAQKTKDRATRTPLKPGWTLVLRKGKQHPSWKKQINDDKFVSYIHICICVRCLQMSSRSMRLRLILS